MFGRERTVLLTGSQPSVTWCWCCGRHEYIDDASPACASSPRRSSRELGTHPGPRCSYRTGSSSGPGSLRG
jgi:hypothetical protein